MEYDKPCKTCGGTGGFQGSFLSTEENAQLCWVCKGSGRIKTTIKDECGEISTPQPDKS